MVDRRDVTHTLRGLEARKLISRSADPGDARRMLAELADAGESLLERLDRVVDEVQNEAFASLTATQRDKLLNLLQQLR